MVFISASAKLEAFLVVTAVNYKAVLVFKTNVCPIKKLLENVSFTN